MYLEKNDFADLVEPQRDTLFDQMQHQVCRQNTSSQLCLLFSHETMWQRLHHDLYEVLSARG